MTLLDDLSPASVRQYQESMYAPVTRRSHSPMRLIDSFDLIATVSDDNGTYQWAIVGVFRRQADGVLFWDADAGCSCYGPWTGTDLDPKPLAGKEQAFIDAASGISKVGHEKAQEILKKLREGLL